MNKHGLAMGWALVFMVAIAVYLTIEVFWTPTGATPPPQVGRQQDRSTAAIDPESDLWPSCIHEASHTVAALASGNRVQFTRLTSDGDGQTSHSGPAGPRANAIIALAGCVGERVLARNLCDGSERDFRFARLRGGKNYLDLIPEAEKLIRKHRAAILRIARELSQKRYLTGRRARQLFKEAEYPKRLPAVRSIGQIDLTRKLIHSKESYNLAEPMPTSVRPFVSYRKHIDTGA